MHDQRQFWSVWFGEIIAGTGASIQGDGIDMLAYPELGYPQRTPEIPGTAEEACLKVEPVRVTQSAKLWWDCLGVCMFSVRGPNGSLRLTTQSLAQAVGWDDFTTEEALQVGERVTTMMRLVYGRRGFKKSDEFDVSPKQMEAPPVGPSQGLSLAPYLPAMVD